MENMVIAEIVLLSFTVLLLIILVFRSKDNGRNVEIKLLERLNHIQSENRESRTDLLHSLEARMQSMSERNQREIGEMRILLDRELNQHLSSRLNESFARVAQSIESIQRGLGEMSAIAKDTKALRDVLTNVKNRGVFGEVLLGKLLSDMLAPHQYVENLSFGNNKIVEFAVKLPGISEETVYLPIDSKFPAESYQRIIHAEDRAQLESARKELYKAVKEFAKQIAEYIRVPKTTNFALMFLPTEGLYSEVARNYALMEEVRNQYSVIIVGATTLSGFLTSLLVGFKTFAIEKKSKEVWDILSVVKREFSQFESTLQKARAQMDKAETLMDELLSNRIRRMNRALRNIELPDEDIREDGME